MITNNAFYILNMIKKRYRVSRRIEIGTMYKLSFYEKNKSICGIHVKNE